MLRQSNQLIKLSTLRQRAGWMDVLHVNFFSQLTEGSEKKDHRYSILSYCQEQRVLGPSLFIIIILL